ncbi:MAG: Fur family transcriptional regulator [Flavobacteriaceae bacterium]
MSARAATLTRNQQLVLDALAGARAPLSAYAILDELRPSGLRAPLQVYRALDKLVDAGLVHRIESMNAFVACSAPERHSHEAAVFMLCEDCGDVTEFADHAVAHRLDDLCEARDFEPKKQTVEIRGTCAGCRETARG